MRKLLLMAALALVAGLMTLGGWQQSATASHSPLAARWHLNQITGGTVADISAHGNTGTVSGATLVPGRFGKGLSFDGIDDYAFAADGAGTNNLDGFSGLTIEAWINLVSFGTGGCDSTCVAIVSKYNTQTGFVSYYLDLEGGQLRILVLESFDPLIDAYATTDSLVLTFGTWYHVAGTWNGSEFKLYVNGVLEPSTTTIIGSFPDKMQDNAIGVSLGRFESDGSGSPFGFFDGVIDEVRIWSCALSADDIARRAVSNSLAAGSCRP